MGSIACFAVSHQLYGDSGMMIAHWFLFGVLLSLPRLEAAEEHAAAQVAADRRLAVESGGLDAYTGA